MFDILYENIGGKIKSYAKWVFIIEAICAVITGIAMIGTGDMILYGILTLVLGPVIAWVGSWILYAFGEIVEKTCYNEDNTRQILKKLDAKITDNSVTLIEKKEDVNNTIYTLTQSNSHIPTHKWLCDSCRKMRTQTPCEHCGKE